jgi:uncharacterized membrane protein YkvA (DUF1232 family)
MVVCRVEPACDSRPPHGSPARSTSNEFDPSESMIPANTFESMDFVLNQGAIDGILRELPELGDAEAVDAARADYEQLAAAITTSPLAARLPGPHPGGRFLPPPLGAASQIGSIPSEYFPAIEFIADHFGAVVEPTEFWNRFLDAVTRFLRWILGKKRTAGTQLRDILLHADQHYAELRERVRKLRTEFDGDNTLELIFFLPDLFVYLCRLLADPEVPRAFKVEIALAVIYVAMPLDLIPEGVIAHPVALLDDVGIALYVLERGFDAGYLNFDAVQRHWPGDPEAFADFHAWFHAVKEVLGENPIEVIFEFLRRFFRSRA